MTTFSANSEFVYHSFYDNLIGRISEQEIQSLNVLGSDFFTLVDELSSDLLLQHQHDYLLLEMDLQTFHWELQVYVNQFLRESCGSPLRLRSFCKQFRQQLQDDPSFAMELNQSLVEGYQTRFYPTPSPELLV
jgi:hypothetical protein